MHSSLTTDESLAIVERPNRHTGMEERVLEGIVGPRLDLDVASFSAHSHVRLRCQSSGNPTTVVWAQYRSWTCSEWDVDGHGDDLDGGGRVGLRRDVERHVANYHHAVNHRGERGYPEISGSMLVELALLLAGDLA